MNVRTLALLNWAAHPLLAVGLCAPCMPVTPRMAPVEGLARWLGLVKQPETYSVLSGTWRLLTTGHPGIGLVLLLFSVLFPVAKLVVLRACLDDARRGRPPGPLFRWTERLSKFSMADVLVVALLVVTSKSYPGGTTVDVRWGLFAFAAAALLSVAVSLGTGRLARP